MTPDDYTEVREYVESNFTLQLGTISAAVVLVYDIWLTFDVEVELVWRRKLSAVSVLYVVNRYIEVAAYVPAIMLFFPVQQWMCSPLNLLAAISTTLPYLAWAGFASMRMHALSNRHHLFTALVFVLNAAYIVPDMYLYTHRQYVDSPYPYSCLQHIPPNTVLIPLMFAARSATLLGELIVLAWTLKTFWQSREAGENWRFRSLTNVLLTDSVACFSIPLILNATYIALTIARSGSNLILAQIIVAFRDSITSVLVSRFILDLRSLSADFDTEDRDEAFTTCLSSNLSRVTFVLPDLDTRAGLGCERGDAMSP